MGRRHAYHSDLVDLVVTLVHETDGAWKVHDGKTTVWVPKAIAELSRNPGSSLCTLTLSEYHAVEKGLA